MAVAARRRTSWEDNLVNISVASGSRTNPDLMVNLSEDETRGTTITRVILDLWLFSTTVAGAWGIQKFDLGMQIVSVDALNAAAVPDPDAASEQPVRGWLYRNRCAVMQNGAGAPVFTRCVADLHMQRRVDNGKFILSMVNTAQRGTSFTVEVLGITRTLLLLP